MILVDSESCLNVCKLSAAVQSAYVAPLQEVQPLGHAREREKPRKINMRKR